MKTSITKVSENGKERITSASFTIERKQDGEIVNQDLTPKLGELLRLCINDLYHQMVDSNAVDGTITLDSMNSFYGNTLKITLIRKN